MKKYIDLTLPIVPHWRCMHEDEIIEKCSTDKGDPASVTRFPLQTHWYTHIARCLPCSERQRSWMSAM